jgi:transcriptional regulator with XRE-family HTH domain
MKDIYNNIRSIRILKNLSQEHLAESLGVSQSSYGKLERGATKITWDKLVKIAAILNTTEWDIVNFGKIREYQLPSQREPEKPTIESDASHMRSVAILQERVKYLEQVNELLQKQLSDKDEIITLLKVGKGSKDTKKK